MKIVYDRAFFDKLKKVDVRIRKRVKRQMLIFSKNPNDPSLHNHALRDEWKGYRSINITNDVRALYKEVQIGQNNLAYFVTVGTHKELYG